MSHTRQTSEISRPQPYTPDSFFEHALPPPKTLPMAITMPSWLSRNESSKASSSTASSSTVPVLRISEPLAINTLNSRTVRPSKAALQSPSHVLGMGAQVVRTPSEALAGFELFVSNKRDREQQLQQQGGRQSSESSRATTSPELATPALPPIPKGTFDLPPPKNLAARRSPRSSKSSPHLKNGQSALPSPPRKSAELPPLPTFRPISTFTAEQIAAPALPVKATALKTRSSTQSQTTTVDSCPLQPPFLPVLVSPAAYGTHIREPHQILVSIETTSSNMTTTLSTLTAAPSRLATFAREQISAHAPECPPPSLKRHDAGGAVLSPAEAAWMDAFREHQDGLSSEPADRYSVADSASEYSSASPPVSPLPSPIATKKIAPVSPLRMIPESAKAKSPPALGSAKSLSLRQPQSQQSPSQRMHIFLDRPSGPYSFILAFLRSLPTAPAPPTPPTLPTSLLNLPASSAVRMATLLEVRDEAAFLGMALLEQACEVEINRRRAEHALKRGHGMSQSVSSSVNSSQVSLSDAFSGGHSTAVEHESRPPSSSDPFGHAQLSPHHPYSAAGSASAQKRSMVVSAGEVMAGRISASGPSPISPPSAMSMSMSSSPGRASALRHYMSASTSALPTMQSLFNSNGSTPKPATPSGATPLSPKKMHNRFPQSVDITPNNVLSDDGEEDSAAWNPMSTLTSRFYASALSPTITRPFSSETSGTAEGAEMGFLGLAGRTTGKGVSNTTTRPSVSGSKEGTRI